MSEKFHYNSAQERSDANELNKDFVNVGLDNRAHVTGSKKKNGSFVSDHQLRMIEANASQIYDGMENRENESLLEAIGDSTNPDDIREFLRADAFIDDDENDPMTDEEVLDYVKSIKQEVESYYNEARERGEAAKTDKSSAVETHAPKHRAQYSDSDSPIFDEQNAKYHETTQSDPAHENESMEEYEARQIQASGGKHRANHPDDEPFTPIPRVDTSRLEVKMNQQPHTDGPVPLVDTSALEARNTANTPERQRIIPPMPEQSTDTPRAGMWRNLHQRMVSVFNGEAASAATLWLSSRSQKRQEQSQDSDANKRERRYAKPFIAVGAIAVAFAGGVLAQKYGFDAHHGGSSTAASSGGGGEYAQYIDSFLNTTPGNSGGGAGGGD